MKKFKVQVVYNFEMLANDIQEAQVNALETFLDIDLHPEDFKFIITERE